LIDNLQPPTQFRTMQRSPTDRLQPFNESLEGGHDEG
jgi:hypothetical protein